MKRRPERTPEETRRRAARVATRKTLDALTKLSKFGTNGTAERGRGKRDPKPEQLSVLYSLETGEPNGVMVEDGAPHAREIRSLLATLASWRIAPAYPAGPLRVVGQSTSASAQPKARKIRSPAWLDLVRRLPCYVCTGAPANIFLFTSVLSEAHHWPSKGRSAGGSDLETMPLCTDHHAKATANALPAEMQAKGVATTTCSIFTAMRLGRIPPEILLAVAVEVVLHDRA